MSLLQTVFQTAIEPRIHGVVSLEHDGRPANKHDGVCLTVIVTLDNVAADEVKITDEKRYQWLTVSDSNVIGQLDAASLAAVALRS